MNKEEQEIREEGVDAKLARWSGTNCGTSWAPHCSHGMKGNNP